MKTPLDKQVYAGMMEILKDGKLYYHSSVGSDFNHLTDAGEKAVIEYISIMAPHMLKHYEHELDERAKRLVIQELKS